MLSQIVDEFIAPDKFPNIIDFIENPWPKGWNQTLIPTQKFIFKLIYGLPLDRVTKCINITNKFQDQIKKTYTESDYFKFLVSEGRINIDTPPDHRAFLQVLLDIGRRGSKSSMSVNLSVYEINRILNSLKDPHKHFGITLTDEIRVTTISKAKKQAKIIYNQIRQGVLFCDSLGDFKSGDTSEEINFLTPGQIDRYKKWKVPKKDWKGLLSAFVGACDSGSVRGPGTIVLIMDEFAFFLDSDGSQNDAAVYEAITPSLSAFNLEALIVLISSPNRKSGKFYEIYKLGMDKGGLETLTLVLQIPTWGMNNPSVSSAYLKYQYNMLGHNAYMREYGAQFVEGSDVWLTDDSLIINSIDENRSRKLMGDRHRRYFWGLDIGLSTDAFGLGITHIEDDKRILDYAVDYYADPAEREAIRLRNLNYNIRDIYEFTRKSIQMPQHYDDLVKELKQVHKRFPCAYGIMDQWSGVVFSQLFEDNGIRNIKKIDFTEALNSDIYKLWKLLMIQKNFNLYEDTYILEQILSLQQEARRKEIVIVEAPKISGFHDDISDAIARSIWASYDFFNQKDGKGKNRPKVASPKIGQSPYSYLQHRQMKALKHKTDNFRRF